MPAGIEIAAAPLQLPDPVPEGGPLVSILTTSYNYASFIGSAIESALQQTYRDIEIIVSDNVSTDGSWDVIQELARRDDRLRIHRHDLHISAFENVRSGLARAQGTYCQIVNADDRIADRRAVAILVAALESDRDIVLATSRRQLIDGAGAALPDTVLTEPLLAANAVVEGIDLGDILLSRLVNTMSESTTMFRRELLADDAALFSIGTRGPRTCFFDVVWWLKILAQGKVAYLSETLGQYRIHRAQIGADWARQDPMAMVDWFEIIKGAKELGFLRKPIVELRCVSTLLSFIAGQATGYRDAPSEHLAELTRVTEELGTWRREVQVRAAGAEGEPATSGTP